ncbi:hypothetical protein F4815DRAFT_468654 [Daldinia loculata]|nr:hypothetical protein F4815DRAFT_468654 [Daldinia loculata]
MTGRYNYKNQDAYKEYAGHPKRPDGLPEYEMDDGIPKVAPGELFCRARLPNGQMCTNDTKQYQPSNLRNHLKNTHGYEIKNLPAGQMNSVDHQLTNDFYVSLMKRANDNALEETADDTAVTDTSPISTPSKTARVTRRSASAASSRVVKQELHSIPRKKNSKVDGRTMRKMVGLSGKACDSCTAKGRKASACPPDKPDGVCEVWKSFKKPSEVVLNDSEVEHSDA